MPRITLVVVPGTFDRFGNLGVLQKVVDLLQPETFKVEIIDYPATLLFPCSYRKSCAVGTAKLSMKLQELEAAGTAYSILGYSQGAEVVARTLVRHSSRYTNMICTVLMGSPVRAAGSAQGLFGDVGTSKDWEILGDRVLELANPMDLVCSAGKGSKVKKIAGVVSALGGGSHAVTNAAPTGVKATITSAVVERVKAALYKHPGWASHVAYASTRPTGSDITYVELAARFFSDRSLAYAV